MRHYPEKAPDADDHHLPPSQQVRWSVRTNPFYYDTDALAQLAAAEEYQGCDNCRHAYTETVHNVSEEAYVSWSLGHADRDDGRPSGHLARSKYVRLCSFPHDETQDPNGPCNSWKREPTDADMEWDGDEESLHLPPWLTIYRGGTE